MSKIDIDHIRSIPAFYAGQNIFLTGATGFLGKIFVEKVLRSCHEVREIFLLIRPKKGMNIVERLEKMLSSPLFDRVRNERPSSFEKLIPISGNTSEKGLGLSPVDRQTLIEKVTIIVHNSASIKFNDSIKYAIFANTRSTKDICVLAESMKNLVALVYVGTVFAQTDHSIVEEKVYPSKADWRKTIKIVESLDNHSLNIFTAKYLDNAVNTYTFSKNLAESIIQEYSSSLPCVIFRPSMVTPAVDEPYQGWIDNANGPMGLSIAGGKGLLHVVYCSKEVCQDWIPVDVVIKSLLHVIWKRGATTIMPDSTPLVFNCSSGNSKKVSMNENVQLGNIVLNEVPFKDMIWIYNITFTTNYALFYILTMLWHILPALLMDLILKLVKLQRKIYVANCALKHFMINEWTFDNTNTMNLNEIVPTDDEKEFKFRWTNVDRKTYITNAILGSKKFFLHEDVSQAAIDAARARSRRISLFVAVIKTCITVGTLWAIYQQKIYSLILLFHLIFSFNYM